MCFSIEIKKNRIKRITDPGIQPLKRFSYQANHRYQTRSNLDIWPAQQVQRWLRLVLQYREFSCQMYIWSFLYIDTLPLPETYTLQVNALRSCQRCIHNKLDTNYFRSWRPFKGQIYGSYQAVKHLKSEDGTQRFVKGKRNKAQVTRNQIASYFSCHAKLLL